MYKINSRLPEPIYEQIMNCIKKNIVENLLHGKDKIPSVREMARILTTNPNTVAKAYRELERQQVIEVIKGRGTYVTEFPLKSLQSNEREKDNIKNEIRNIIQKSKYYGISQEQLKKWIDEN